MSLNVCNGAEKTLLDFKYVTSIIEADGKPILKLGMSIPKGHLILTNHKVIYNATKSKFSFEKPLDELIGIEVGDNNKIVFGPFITLIFPENTRVLIQTDIIDGATQYVDTLNEMLTKSNTSDLDIVKLTLPTKEVDPSIAKKRDELRNLILLTGVSEKEMERNAIGLDYLAETLPSNEKVYYCMIAGPVDGFGISISSPVIVVTNTKVIVAGRKSDLIKTASSFTIDLEKIESVHSDPGFIAYSMWIMTNGNKIVFSFVGSKVNNHGQKIIDGFEDAIKKAREENKKISESPQITSTVSVADEIKKFKELLDLGILTQEEFDTKKKQLLGL